MEVNLSTLTTPQLLAIRRILTDGATAFASTETTELKNLREYKARNEILKERREVLADIGVDINEDQDYWAGLDPQIFSFVVQKLITVAQGKAQAENKHMKIPRLIAPQPEKRAFEIALACLRERAKHVG
jgi:hypothetical protein